ncbi:PolC-type DNA polymerase III [Bifidobacterium biavatii]|uniref:DNA polymerase III polC-type n=1 Tax=Bifidobacterium biavatii DSM 23969 TaxID=1437608 RepID=A0A086ZU56_9BIFI|nr:3'-5' exonuclease [Bifidobacterium biavatii]KFI50056.1 DNA polymerase III polC-type [Bifidobacterium biavatii DSM 23969]
MGLLSWLKSLFGGTRDQSLTSDSRSLDKIDPTAYAMLQDFRSKAFSADAVVIDTETTGTGSDLQIVEIGAILLHGGNAFYEYEQLINPNNRLSEFTKELTGITEDDLVVQPNARQIIPSLVNAMRPLTVIGHNVAYDIAAINQELDRANRPRFESISITDTMLLGRRMFPDAPSMSLVELSRLLDVADSEEHRALTDAKQTLECWQLLSSMIKPAKISRRERQELDRRAIEERRRRDHLFFMSQYLEERDITPVNEQPVGIVIKTFECGVAVSGCRDHQDILRKYGYDAWLWVFVLEDLIRKGMYVGYPTYWVYLDGEEIGHITKKQMERHYGQVPAEGAVMIAHIPNQEKDKRAGMWRLRLQMPFDHDPADLPMQVPKPSRSIQSRPPPEPEPIDLPREATRQASGKARDITFINKKPHTKVLSPIGRVVIIDVVHEADVIFSELTGSVHAWVMVKPVDDQLVVRLKGQIIGTVDLPADLTPYGNEARVTAAVISKDDGGITISVELP